MFKSVITPEMHYDDWAQQYDSDVKGWGYHAPNRVLETIKPFLLSHPDTVKMLDVGIGTGLLSKKSHALRDDLDITGIDISSKMLDVCARRHVARRLERVDVSRDVFPFDDGCFDVVAASGLMENVENISNTVAEMARVTRPGGLIAFTYMPAVRHPLREKLAKKLRPGRTKDGRFVMGNLNLYRHNPDVVQQLARMGGVHTEAVERFVGYRTYVVMTVDYDLFAGRKTKGLQ